VPEISPLNLRVRGEATLKPPAVVLVLVRVTGRDDVKLLVTTFSWPPLMVSRPDGSPRLRSLEIVSWPPLRVVPPK
jgi:hypothetical protein